MKQVLWVCLIASTVISLYFAGQWNRYEKRSVSLQHQVDSLSRPIILHMNRFGQSCALQICRGDSVHIPVLYDTVNWTVDHESFITTGTKAKPALQAADHE
jgi:hypothetical protein